MHVLVKIIRLQRNSQSAEIFRKCACCEQHNKNEKSSQNGENP